ncbi:MAG: DUF4825 domain-containing protein [Cellulosilyticum sp.]|nr:DUF4825 domain-containing protein [Cellulosilyticum sp.]
MKKLMIVLMLILLVIVGYGKSTNRTELLDYKDSYVGDNSAVGNIINLLPAHEYLDGFELQTAQEPYAITINYKNFDQMAIKLEDGETQKVSLDEILQGNAMVILSLVKNAEIVNFNVEGHDSISFDRLTLSDNYGSNLDSISQDVSSLQNFINTYTHKVV